MSDNEAIRPPFDGDDETAGNLWAALGELPREVPTENLRRRFYRELAERGRPRFSQTLQRWLGISGRAGWATAAACLLAGIAVGNLPGPTDSSDPNRLSALEQNLALLNRELILSRLDDTAASQRLRGVVDARNVVGADAEITRALLVRATEDRVLSVRTAAIDALGSNLSDAAVGAELMQLLSDADSPLVQLALVDLVLRHGDVTQLNTLLQLATEGALHPALVRHVETSLGKESI